MGSPGFIEEDLYKKILEAIPVVCVDALIVHNDEFLLGRRQNKPAKGEWFTPGGRVMKGETLVDAIVRKVREETGLADFEVEEQLGAKETIFNDSEQGPSSHTVNIMYRVIARSKERRSADSQNSDLQWFAAIDPTWHPYVKMFLEKAGFTELTSTV